MARFFDVASSEYLAFDQATITGPTLPGYPFGISCWYMCPTLPAGYDFCLVFRCRPANRNSYFSLAMRTISPATYPSFIAEASNGTFTFFVNSGIVPNDGQWYHLVAVFPNNTTRSIWVDETEYSIARTVAPSFGKLIEVGRLGKVTPTDYLLGNVADVNIFDATNFNAAVAAEWASRRSIVSSMHMEWSSFFVPFVGDEDRDITHGHRQVATTGGTPIVQPHPPISYPIIRPGQAFATASAIKPVTLGTLHGMTDVVLAG